jgi:hypothetical protein
VFHSLCGIPCGAALAYFVVWDVPPELTDLLDSTQGLVRIVVFGCVWSGSGFLSRWTRRFLTFCCIHSLRSARFGYLWPRGDGGDTYVVVVYLGMRWLVLWWPALLPVGRTPWVFQGGGYLCSVCLLLPLQAGRFVRYLGFRHIL